MKRVDLDSEGVKDKDNLELKIEREKWAQATPIPNVLQHPYSGQLLRGSRYFSHDGRTSSSSTKALKAVQYNSKSLRMTILENSLDLSFHHSDSSPTSSYIFKTFPYLFKRRKIERNYEKSWLKLFTSWRSSNAHEKLRSFRIFTSKICRTCIKDFTSLWKLRLDTNIMTLRDFEITKRFWSKTLKRSRNRTLMITNKKEALRCNL